MRKTLSRVLAAASAVVGFTLLATPAFAQSTVYDYGYTTAGDAAAATAFGGLSLVWALCVCCVPLLIDIAIAYWIYKDAKKLKIENEVLWAVLGLLFSFVGLIIYLLIPRQEATKKSGGSSETPKSE